MAHWIVKVTHTNGQTRLAIPRELAESTGLDKAEFAFLENPLVNMITLEEYDGQTSRKTGFFRS